MVVVTSPAFDFSSSLPKLEEPFEVLVGPSVDHNLGIHIHMELRSFVEPWRPDSVASASVDVVVVPSCIEFVGEGSIPRYC